MRRRVSDDKTDLLVVPPVVVLNREAFATTESVTDNPTQRLTQL